MKKFGLQKNDNHKKAAVRIIFLCLLVIFIVLVFLLPSLLLKKSRDYSYAVMIRMEYF